MPIRTLRSLLSGPRSVAFHGAVAGLGVVLGCVSASHAATITWDGGGGNLNWLTAANWSGDVLPGPGDDVVIDAAGTVTIALAGSASVNSITCADALTVSGGGTLTVAGSANVSGLLSLTNGKLSGGAWTLPAGLLPTDGNLNTLTGVTLNGNASIGTNNRLYLSGGLTLNGTMALTGSNPRLVFNGTQTIGGNATIQLTGNTNNPARLNVDGASVATLAPTVLIECGIADLGNSVQSSGVSTLLNNGTIRSLTAGAATTIAGEQFVNNGTVEATAGTLTLAPTTGIVNDGLLRALTSGSLVLAGPIAASDLGDVRNVSGSVLIQTTIDLLGGTLALDAVTGVWTFNGGGLTGGTLAIAAGASPLFTSANSTFTAMTVDGNLALGGSQRLWFTNGLTLNGTLAMSGSNPYLVANGTQTLGGNATIQLDGNNNNPARLTVEGASTLTIAPTVLIEGSRGSVGLHIQTAGISSVVNQGTIRGDTSGTTFDLLGENFINEGVIESTAGTLRLSPSVSWTNTGTMTSLGGTLRLEGATTLASFEGISNQGGALQSSISVDLDDESYTIPIALSPLTLDGGTWSNGTLVIEPGVSVAFTSGQTTFDGITVNGDLALGSNARLWFTNGLTVNGTVSMTGANAYLVANGTQTLGGNATILLDAIANNPARITVEGTSTLTIAPSVLIEGGWGVIGVAIQSGVSSVINQGTIRCDTPSATFVIEGEHVVNNGTIECTNGTLRVTPSQTFVNTGTASAIAGSLTVQPAQTLSNSGLLRANGGTLTVGGSVDLANLGDVRNIAGTLLFKSLLDLNGGTLTLSNTTGVWTFDGGSLADGTLVVQPGSDPLFTSANNLFDAVTVNGNLTLGSSGRLRYSNGLIMNGTLALTGGNPYLIAVGTQTLGGNATIQLDGSINNPARLAVDGVMTLTIAPTVMIEGGWASVGANLQGNVDSSVVNLTTIRCDTANGVFSFQGAKLVNAGTIEVTAGTMNVSPTESWTNSGLIRANGGTLGLVGPVNLADLGDVRNVSGTLLVKSTVPLNGGTLALNATTGVWTFDGGSLVGGTLSTQTGSLPLFTTANTTFNAMTVNGNLALGATQRLWFTNGLTLNGTLTLTGAAAALIANGTQSLGGNALIQLDGLNTNPARIAVEGTSNLTIAPTVLIEGSGGSVGAFIQNADASSILNQGTIRARTAAGQFTIATVAGDTFTNQGSVEATNGNSLFVESATNLDAAGQLTGGVWKANNATLRFGTAATGTPIKTLAAECVLAGRNGKILDLAKLETIAINGVLRLSDGAVLTAVPATGTLVDNGFLFINGTSKLNVTGGFTHTATAILTVATGAANQILVDASAALNLDGFLQVSNGPGYTPIAGDQIVIADGTSRVGEFDTLTTCELADLFYTPTQAIYVYGEDTGVFADLNGDGFVGAPDLALLLGSWGPCSDLCCNADLDLSGDVGAPDIALLLGGWG